MRRGSHTESKRRRRRLRFGTTVRDIEKAYKAAFPDRPPDPLSDVPALLLSKTEIHKRLRDGAKWYRAGEAMVAAGADDPRTVEEGLQCMRAGTRTQLQAVVTFCFQNMDYRSVDALEVLDRLTDHLLNLMHGVQVPYLLKARPNGNPDSVEKTRHKSACVAARDWLERCCGFSPKEAKELVLMHVKGLKKTTFEGWCKPHSRACMELQLQIRSGELRLFARRVGDANIRIVLDLFLGGTNSGGPPRSSAPSKSQLDGYLKRLDGEMSGFTHIETIARQYREA